MWMVFAWCLLGGAVALRSSRRASDRIIEAQADGRAYSAGRFHTTTAYTIIYVVTLAGLFGGVATRFDGVFRLLAYSVFVGALVMHTFIDLDTHLLLRGVTTRASLIGVPLLFVAAPSRTFASAVGAIVMWAVLRLLFAMSRGGLGKGDVALAPFLGWFIGALSIAQVFVALVSAFVIAGVVVSVALVLRRVKRTTPVPFGPFLAIGAMVTVFAGSRITGWWLG